MRVKELSVIAAFALALGGAACSNEPRDPSETAEQALKQANLDDVSVDWDSDARVAHLKGTVPTTTDRQRAEEVATRAVGTSGRVLNEVTVQGVDEQHADDLDARIRSTLDDAIDQDQVLRDRSVDFDVNNGVVTATGEVRTVAEKNKVTDILRSTPGIKDFANKVDVKPAR